MIRMDAPSSASEDELISGMHGGTWYGSDATLRISAMVIV
jgi:hypothetical protein